jgi:CMP-N-acetylneuraminic acid synthetase
MHLIAMIPARMGSQRLKHKNLRELGGVPLITRAIRKCKAASVFSEIWVNSEHSAFEEIACQEGAMFHLRPEDLGGDRATSEQFVREFLEKHACDLIFQVHSIAPLLNAREVSEFVTSMRNGPWDTLLSYEPIQIECALEGRPVNFSFSEKTNSQDLRPVQRITWSISGWRRDTYLAAAASGGCATYSGNIGLYPVSHLAAHVIKTEDDLRFAEAVLPLVEGTLSA